MDLSGTIDPNAVYFAVVFASKNGYSFVSLMFQKTITRIQI
jgi:hypothetical protein